MLSLGNLDGKRDWGYAPEYCEGMWRILQQPKADDFVLATGETHTVREFVELTFKHLGVTLEWHGVAENETGIVAAVDYDKASQLVGFDYLTNPMGIKQNNDLKPGTTVVKVNPKYYRPTEVDILIGDPSKAKAQLGWEAKTLFTDLVQLMIKSDFAKVLKRGY